MKEVVRELFEYVSYTIHKAIDLYVRNTLTEEELDVLQFIMATTVNIGYTRVYLSMSDFVKGYYDEDGNILAYMSKYPTTGILKGMNGLIDREYIDVTKLHRTNEDGKDYYIHFNFEVILFDALEGVENAHKPEGIDNAMLPM